jgi:hypothetical protein
MLHHEKRERQITNLDLRIVGENSKQTPPLDQKDFATAESPTLRDFSAL